MALDLSRCFHRQDAGATRVSPGIVPHGQTPLFVRVRLAAFMPQALPKPPSRIILCTVPIRSARVTASMMLDYCVESENTSTPRDQTARRRTIVNATDDNKNQFDSARRRMVEEQLRGRGITDENVLAAMATVARDRFLPLDLARHAYEDRALAVGLGQTISQPYIVAYMTATLQLEPTDRVLEIGTGTGYQAAILAQLAAHVYSIERIAKLSERAQRTLSDFGMENITLVVGDGTIGLPEFAPFDRILVTAGAPHVPRQLVEQLGPNGVLVAPVGGPQEQTLVRVTRDGSRTREEPLLGCRFVKLVGEDGWGADVND